jgi:superfamily II DNA or RNA helicase
MVYDIVINKKNEAFVKIECDRGIAQELSVYFEFYVPGYKFMPAFKNKLWDGKIRLFDIRTNTIYYGLVPYIETFCLERGYKVKTNTEKPEQRLTVEEAKEFISTLNIPFEVRDYQLNAFVTSINHKRILILSPTGSGKSLIIYLIIRYLQKTKQKGLLLVPSISLVSQMYKDFKNYGYDSDEYCHKIYGGQEKDSDKFLYISTWQSLYTLKEKYFHQFDFIIGDEAHEFKAKSLTTILSSCVNCDYRIGTTGTLDGTNTHKLVLEGLFGMVHKSTTTTELIQKGQLSKFKIKCLVLKYPAEVCKEMKSQDYQKEIDFLVRNKARNDFIKNLTVSLKGNSLVLFQFVEKHGKELYELIKEKAKERNVFFVYGDTDVEVREEIRAIVEKETDSIIIASYGTFSRGVNINNLHNIVFASPSKSRIRNLQSIGRSLRLGNNKEMATLYDIADDLKVGKHTNHTLKHFIERVKIYDEEKFEYKFYPIDLKNR